MVDDSAARLDLPSIEDRSPDSDLDTKWPFARAFQRVVDRHRGTLSDTDVAEYVGSVERGGECVPVEPCVHRFVADELGPIRGRPPIGRLRPGVKRPGEFLARRLSKAGPDGRVRAASAVYEAIALGYYAVCCMEGASGGRARYVPSRSPRDIWGLWVTRIGDLVGTAEEFGLDQAQLSDDVTFGRTQFMADMRAHGLAPTLGPRVAYRLGLAGMTYVNAGVALRVVQGSAISPEFFDRHAAAYEEAGPWRYDDYSPTG